MKLLVIGIDGGTKEILEGMPMPFTQSLLATAHSKTLDEDLISRGWAEALTGQHAASNKGFYLMPCNDGSYDFSASYSKNDMLTASSNPPLWTVLNEKGASVGIVNVPTTGPADEVNGFIIAGGGGGIKTSGVIPDGMVYPARYKAILEKNRYVFDLRLPGETGVSSFFKKIREAEQVQKDTFIELARETRPDFGFHCFRITTEVQYLARYEIDRCMEHIRQCKQQGIDFTPESTVQASIIAHYVSLDNSIKDLFEALQPESYLFIGDHSTALLQHEGNMDVWLSQRGYLAAYREPMIFLSKLKRFARRRITRLLNLKPTPKAPLIRNPLTRFYTSRTRAFGTFYDTGNFAGIFINDARFSGPVSASETPALVDKICSEFNADPIAARYSLEARPYRRLHEGEPFQTLMPDIKIHKPDSVYFSSRRWAFMVANPNLKPLEEDLKGIRYPHSGAKGRDPLFVYSQNLQDFIKPSDPNDLRLVYHLVSRLFDKPGSSPE